MKTAKLDLNTMIAACRSACDRPLVERTFTDMAQYFRRVEIDEWSMDLGTIMSDSSDPSKKHFDQ